MNPQNANTVFIHRDSIKKTIQQIADNLFGDSTKISLENRIFNTVMFFIGLTGITTLIYGVIIHDNIYQIAVSSLCAVIPGCCYLYSLKKRTFRKLITPANIFFYLALTAAWFFTNGVHGSLPFFFFVLVTYGNIFIKNPFKLYLPFILTSIIALLIAEYYWPFLFFKYSSRSQEFLDIGISLILCLIINGSIIHFVFREYFRERTLKDEILIQTLKDKETIDKAFKEIRVLRGFLPICANCKKIKDGEGTWKRLEEYISMHSEAQFSHGICPACVKELYPDHCVNDEQQSLMQ